MPDERRQHIDEGRVGRMVKAASGGHYVHVTEPDLVVDEVKWILGELDLS